MQDFKFKNSSLYELFSRNEVELIKKELEGATGQHRNEILYNFLEELHCREHNKFYYDILNEISTVKYENGKVFFIK